MKKAIIKNNIGESMIYDIIPIKDILKYDFNSTPLCIEYNGYILPITNDKKYSGPHAEVCGCICRYVLPIEGDERYLKENVINFDNDKIRGFITHNNKMNDELKNRIKQDAGNVYKPVLDENTGQVMKLFRNALGKKQIIIDSYKEKFEKGKFNNHKKSIIDDDNITLKKLKLWCDIFDIKLSISLSDKDDDIPNPIGEGVIIEDIIE